MLHACDACWYCMIICSVFMVPCLWNWAGLEALGHHPSSCTCITHSQNIPSSGVAQPREQIIIARRLPFLTTRYSSPISFLSLNVMRRFTTLITETPGIRALFYARLWRGCTGKALILGKTLTIRLWSIRLDCDAAQVGYVHTIKKLSIILKKNLMDGQKFPLSTPLQTNHTRAWHRILFPDLRRSLNNSPR